MTNGKPKRCTTPSSLLENCECQYQLIGRHVIPHYNDQLPSVVCSLQKSTHSERLRIWTERSSMVCEQIGIDV